MIRLLMNAGTETVGFEGDHFRLEDAVMGLDPYGERPPEIWMAAHGPRMLSLTGRYADGWLPTKMSPAAYRAALDRILAGAREAGRKLDRFTPGMLGYVLIGPDERSVARLLASPMIRMICILMPNRAFESLGVTPPLGDAGGFHDFIPSRVPVEEVNRIVEATPPKVSAHYAFAGTVEAGRRSDRRLSRRGSALSGDVERHRSRRPGPGAVQLPGYERPQGPVEVGLSRRASLIIKH